MEEEFHEMKPFEPEDDEQLDQQDETSFGGQDETSFGGQDETFFDGPTTISDVRAVRRRLVHRDCKDFFTNVIDLEPQCSQPEFVDHLVDSGVLSIGRVFNKFSKATDYKVRYLGGNFESVLRTLSGYDTNLLRDGIREHYDGWTKQRLKETMKKAGIVAAVGLGVIALVTGLSVGLTRKGADIVHQAKEWEKLQPSKKITTIPWTTIEKAGGKTIIFAGEYLIVIGVGCIWILLRKR